MTFLTVFSLRRTSKNKEMDVYAQLVFLEGDIRFEDSSHPIPNWPFQSLESLLTRAAPASSGTLDYFKNLTTGQFLCFIHSAKNFEAYSLTVKKEPTYGTLWYGIMTMWLCHFTDSKLECKALRAFYNRGHWRLKETQKRFHVRGDSRVKDTVFSFLNSKIVLPKKKNVHSDLQQRYEILNNVPQMEGVSRSTAAKNYSFNDALLENNKLKKISTAGYWFEEENCCTLHGWGV